MNIFLTPKSPKCPIWAHFKTVFTDYSFLAHIATYRSYWINETFAVNSWEFMSFSQITIDYIHFWAIGSIDFQKDFLKDFCPQGNKRIIQEIINQHTTDEHCTTVTIPYPLSGKGDFNLKQGKSQKTFSEKYAVFYNLTIKKPNIHIFLLSLWQFLYIILATLK